MKKEEGRRALEVRNKQRAVGKDEESKNNFIRDAVMRGRGIKETRREEKLKKKVEDKSNVMKGKE